MNETQGPTQTDAPSHTPDHVPSDGASDETVDRKLERIEARLDRLEASISRLTDVLDQAPMMMASVTDTFDSYAARGAEQGVDVDARSRQLARVAGKLTDPKVLDSLEMIADRADRLHETVEVLDQLPGQAAMFADVADSYLTAAAEQGVDVDARLRQLARVLGKSTDPKILGSIEKIVDRADEFEAAVDVLENLPDGFATVVDVIDETIARATERGIDIVDLGRTIGAASAQFARFIQGPEFEMLKNSGVLDPEAVAAVGRAGRALAQTTQNGGPDKAGFFALMGAMRDEDVRRAMGFAVTFARRFGRALGDDPKQLPE